MSELHTLSYSKGASRMTRSRRSSLVLCCSLLAVPLIAGEATAGQLVRAQTTFNSSGAKTVGVNFNGKSGTYYAAPFATTIKTPAPGSITLYDQITTFCVDFINSLNQSELDADLLDVDAGSPIVTGSVGGGSLDRNIGAAAYLMAAVLGTDPVPLSSLTLNPIQRAALQVAIWEVTYDWNSGSYATDALAKARLTSSPGLFRMTSYTNGDAKDIYDQAALYLVSAWDSSAGQFRTSSAKFLNYPPGEGVTGTASQDQLFIIPTGGTGGGPTPVPEPSTFAMAGIALILGLGVHRRRAVRRVG